MNRISSIIEDKEEAEKEFKEDYNRPKIFWENYHGVMQIRDMIELKEEESYHQKTIRTIKKFRKILYDSFRDIQNGDYTRLHLRIHSLETDEDIEILKNLAYLALDKFLNAYHATIPKDIKGDSLTDTETDRKELEKLVESFA